MSAWVRYLVAALVAVHGLVYLNAARGVLPGAFEGWRGRSWLLGGAIVGGALKKLSVGLWSLTGVLFIATALAIAFSTSVHGAWRPAAIVAAAAGVLSFAFFWDGQPDRLVAQGILGLVISLAVLAGAVAFPGAFGARVS